MTNIIISAAADVRFWLVRSYLIVCRASSTSLEVLRVPSGFRDLPEQLSGQQLPPRVEECPSIGAAAMDATFCGIPDREYVREELIAV